MIIIISFEPGIMYSFEQPLSQYNIAQVWVPKTL